jgi:hypothetical protein
MCPPEHVWLGWVSFCIKQSAFLFYSRVLRVVWVVWVGVSSRVVSVMGRGGGEGRVPSLMAASVEREVTYSNFFSLNYRPWGIRLKRERNYICINPKGISPWVTLSAVWRTVPSGTTEAEASEVQRPEEENVLTQKSLREKSRYQDRTAKS